MYRLCINYISVIYRIFIANVELMYRLCIDYIYRLHIAYKYITCIEADGEGGSEGRREGDIETGRE